MIFYFSGTGNSEWVARQLAERTQDKAVDIRLLSETPDIQEEDRIGFVFPIYAWGPPEAMINFVKKLKPTELFTFAVCTCGRDAGFAMKVFSKYYALDSSYSLTMPNNYIVGTNTENESIIIEKISQARKEMEKIAREILREEKAYRVHEGALSGVKSRLVNFGFNKFARSAKPFSADNHCNGCGLCAKECPASAISIQDGKPVWKAQCYQCMRCINTCPRQAIQYGKSTIGRQRYIIRNFLPQDEK